MTYIFLGPRIRSDCVLGIHRNFHSACIDIICQPRTIQTLDLGDCTESMNNTFGEVINNSCFAESQDHPL